MDRIPQHVDEARLLALLREGIAAGADTIYFRAGYLPLYSGHHSADEIGYRQLNEEDLDAIAGLVLEHASLPEHLVSDRTDAAQALPLFWEIPGEALLQVRFCQDRGAMAIDVEIARPASHREAIRALL